VVLEALRAGTEVKRVFVADGEDLPRELLSLAARRDVPVLCVSPAIVSALSDTVTPQGVVAVVRAPAVRLDDIAEDASLVLVLAGVRDPGNAGTLVRSAAAARADAVVFAPDTVDPFGPKTVRASAGALFRVPVVTGAGLAEWIHALSARGVRILAADAAGAPADEVDLARPVAFVLGNEASGLPRDLQPHVDARVAIPMPGPLESLNAAVAGSILLFEAIRQRRAR
jgi:TrmH family RNA methyltransferase